MRRLRKIVKSAAGRFPGHGWKRMPTKTPDRLGTVRSLGERKNMLYTIALVLLVLWLLGLLSSYTMGGLIHLLLVVALVIVVVRLIQGRRVP